MSYMVMRNRSAISIFLLTCLSTYSFGTSVLAQDSVVPEPAPTGDVSLDITLSDVRELTDSELRVAIKQLENAQTDQEREVIGNRIEELLIRQFNADITQREKQLEQLGIELRQTEQLLEQRRSNCNAIIDLRLRELINEAKGLGWSEASSIVDDKPGSTAPSSQVIVLGPNSKPLEQPSGELIRKDGDILQTSIVSQYYAVQDIQKLFPLLKDRHPYLTRLDIDARTNTVLFWARAADYDRATDAIKRLLDSKDIKSQAELLGISIEQLREYKLVGQRVVITIPATAEATARLKKYEKEIFAAFPAIQGIVVNAGKAEFHERGLPPNEMQQALTQLLNATDEEFQATIRDTPSSDQTKSRY